MGLQTRATPVELVLPPAHQAQERFINSFDARRLPDGRIIYDDSYAGLEDLPLAYPDLRYAFGACGTKFGKTHGCSYRIAKWAWANRDPVTREPMSAPGLYWWVAPSYAKSKMAYMLVKRLLPKGYYTEYKADLRLEITRPDGDPHAFIEFKSADNDDNLRGFAVHGFILDEAARISREAYDSVLTTVTQTMGVGVVISTPKGRGWFYEEYQKGIKHFGDGDWTDEFPEYTSIRMPTWENPTVPLKSIQTMRRNMPADVFEQEVAARFLLESAGVFRGITGCIKSSLYDSRGKLIYEQPLPGRRYIIGIDLARKKDYTVITVIDAERKHVVYWDRFNQLDWAVQKHKIVEVARRFNRARVWMDATGLGDPIAGDVRNAGIPVEPFVISNNSKQNLIEQLRADIEHQRLTYPQIGTMIKELQAYEYDAGTNGRIKYSAPSGMHDDCVISLALANMGAQQAPLKYRYKSRPGV